MIVYTRDPTTDAVTQQSFVSFEVSIWTDVARALGTSGKFALNIDTNFAFSDGLASGEHEALVTGLGPTIMQRAVRVPLLGMDFIALRAPTMLPYYRTMMEAVHAILGEAFTTRVITAGVTTCDDVRWWLREETARRGFSPGFHPSFALQRRGESGFISGDTVIQPGAHHPQPPFSLVASAQSPFSLVSCRAIFVAHCAYFISAAMCRRYSVERFWLHRHGPLDRCMPCLRCL